MRPGRPEGGQNIENGIKRKIKENIENLERGILTLSKAIKKANYLLRDLQETFIKQMVDDIRERLYQEESEGVGEEILIDLSRINEWMRKLNLILPQIENNFEKTTQETNKLLETLSRKKIMKYLVLQDCLTKK